MSELKKLIMTKGFLTLATGNERYFKLATNLLKSYKLFTSKPLPFAILTDRHNEYTKQFDDVIILKNTKSSYLDKLSILVNCPYDETIFIDADCLAYQDLNQYWDLYDFSYTLSCFGFSYPLDYKDGWFKKENIGKYEKLIKYIPNIHGGCYFIKKSFKCNEIYKLAEEINNNYNKYIFKNFDQPADEPILALCMAIFDCRPIVEKTRREIFFYPAIEDLKVDIFHGTNSCKRRGEFLEDGFLIHWQNNYTKKAIYKSEVDKLNLVYKKGTTQLSNSDKTLIKLRLLFYKSIDFWEAFVLLLKRKIKVLFRV